MGYYVNPRSSTKEFWLKANAVQITEAEARQHAAGDNLVVCLVNNGVFTAAAIAIDDTIRNMFLEEDDVRPKKWFIADRALLIREGFLT